MGSVTKSAVYLKLIFAEKIVEIADKLKCRSGARKVKMTISFAAFWKEEAVVSGFFVQF